MELRILEPGATGTYQHSLPPAMTEGTYRFRTGVEWPLGEEHANIDSEPFEVVS